MSAIMLALNPIAFSLGNLHVRWYGVIITLGVVVAVFLSMREARPRGIDPDDVIDLIFWMLPIGLIGARLYYVIFEWSYYSQNPGDIIKIWNGGLAIYGGLIAAVIVLLVFCYHRFIPTWLLLDVLAPTVLLAQAIGRWGNFMNQEAFGAKTTLGFLQSLHLPEFIITQMNISGAYRQPTFLYESVWSLLGVILLLSLRHRTHLFKQGEVFLSYITWYAVGRAVIEGMRTDSLYLFANIRVSQLLSAILIVAAIAIIIVRRHNEPQLKWYLDGSGKTIPKEK
ncbi:prolipoprotein diacylglyceryl transferase [Lapidilactobacillus mulanensis]|uniref:Phosphatidylglycerol--prolipoprotein diacylglyceryl transferase n=1 Tax=Lapidilactobacillus mulanensis TaxID=2485999 RepID=A0ABW4DR17_9LACO|nr:prolipoprotein diacylglyceryl transferase [Lapidilactobacillus mulanensis]